MRIATCFTNTVEPNMLGTVIISNSDDMQFLVRLIPEALKFSSCVSVAIGKRRWDGQPEDMDKIDAFVSSNRDPRLVYTLYDPIDEARACPFAQLVTNKDMLPEAYARHIALTAMPSTVEHVLFLDSDEVVEGDRLAAWLRAGRHRPFDVVKLACHWYWRLPTLRARAYCEDSIVLIRREHCVPVLLFHDLARTAFYDMCPCDEGKKTRMVVGDDGLGPFVHHYSWCRTHRQMRQKVSTWGHRHPAYLALVDEEFSRPFNGTDFLKHLAYDTVDNTFGIVLQD